MLLFKDHLVSGDPPVEPALLDDDPALWRTSTMALCGLVGTQLT
jgi:hypothetical protein